MPVQYEVGGNIPVDHVLMTILLSADHQSVILSFQELRQVGHLAPVHIPRILQAVANHVADNSVLVVHIQGAGLVGVSTCSITAFQCTYTT